MEDAQALLHNLLLVVLSCSGVTASYRFPSCLKKTWGELECQAFSITWLKNLGAKAQIKLEAPRSWAAPASEEDPPNMKKRVNPCFQGRFSGTAQHITWVLAPVSHELILKKKIDSTPSFLHMGLEDSSYFFLYGREPRALHVFALHVSLSLSTY